MSGYTVKRIDDMEAVYGGAFIRARAELGVESFGMQVIDMPASADQYPEHDHSHDGQEEVYIVVEGAAKLQVAGEEHELRPGTYARVGPGEKRKLVTGSEGARVIAIGGVPGKAYEIADFTVPQEA